MKTVLFWVCLAARCNSIFDEVYWIFIDPRYYGTFSSLEDRIGLLNQEQQHEIDRLVGHKTRQCSEEEFDDYYPIDRLLEF